MPQTAAWVRAKTSQRRNPFDSSVRCLIHRYLEHHLDQRAKFVSPEGLGEIEIHTRLTPVLHHVRREVAREEHGSGMEVRWP